MIRKGNEMAGPNYLLGQGEQYAASATVTGGHKKKKRPVYDYPTAQKRMLPKLTITAGAIQSIPASACPNNEAVAILTLHHEYLAKSAYPQAIIEQSGLRAIGSQSVTITPERISSTTKSPQPTPTVEMFLAGPRDAFVKLPMEAKSWPEGTDAARDLMKIENFRYPSPPDKIKPIRSDKKLLVMEMAVHTGGNPGILEKFAEYLKTLGVSVDLQNRIDVGGLSFIAVKCHRDKLPQIAQFSFLRFAREMPRLRALWPEGLRRNGKGRQPFDIKLPTGRVVDPTIRVAVFDGGCPHVKELSHWVDRYEEDVEGELREYERHGLAVTSALLFGPLIKGTTAPVPFAKVDHYRVLDDKTEHDPQYELYSVLRRIVAALEREEYDFVNLSIGPDIPMDDGDIHPWTAMLDPLLSSGRTLASLAAGNTGRENAAARLNRIQPPGDSVNAITIGACNSLSKDWNRAAYSSIGFGRSPGFMKPDAVAFGGDEANPFFVMDYDDNDISAGIWGTSFASPFALRTGIGIRATLGPVLNPLAIKTLLLHSCKKSRRHRMEEVGWGRIEATISSLITCPAGTANIIYQGTLKPKKWLRAEIPMPSPDIDGDVTIKATICFATPVDTQHPANYTKSGLDVTFRPDFKTILPGKKNPSPKRFFKSKPGALEIVLRRDAHKWETVRQQQRKIGGAELKAQLLIFTITREKMAMTSRDHRKYRMQW